MRIVSLGIAAMTLATAGLATPALAQYGGSPDQQLDGPAPVAVAGKPGLADLQAELEAEPRGGPYDQVDPSAGGGAQDQYDPAAAGQYGPPNEYYGPNGPGGAEEFAGTQPDDQSGPGGPEEYAQIGPDGEADPAYQDQPYGEEGPPPGPAEDGGAYCRRSDGTTGMLVGGGAGALIGSSVGGHGGYGRYGRYGRYGGHRGHGGNGAGAIIGALLGAVIGGAVERNTCR